MHYPPHDRVSGAGRTSQGGTRTFVIAWYLACACCLSTSCIQPDLKQVSHPFMTFASPPPSLSLGSDPPATAPLSPLEEMKLYEQENPSQKHRRSEESGDDRPAKLPKPESGAGKGAPKGRFHPGSGNRPSV